MTPEMREKAKAWLETRKLPDGDFFTTPECWLRDALAALEAAEKKLVKTSVESANALILADRLNDILTAERALADRLAKALRCVEQWEDSESALEAYAAARKEKP